MAKTQQMSFHRKRLPRIKYSDRIIAQTSKRKKNTNRNSKPWLTSLSKFPDTSDLTLRIKRQTSASTVRRSPTKRLFSWSDLTMLRRTSPDKLKIIKKKNVQNHSTDFIIVWLHPKDINIDVEKSHNTLTSDNTIRLSTLNDKIILFKDLKRCLNYLSTILTKKIFFIISGSFGKTALPLICEYQKIQFIYIDYSHKVERKKWPTITAEKIRGVFHDKNSLMDKLKEDLVTMYSSQNMLPSISILSLNDKEKSVQDMDKEKANFLWFQLLLEILLHFPSRATAKKEMINESKLQYYDNEFELQRIDEFERDYNSTNAISWYTRDCFLYRLLNRAFRLQDIDIIFKFRFIILDIYKELDKLHRNFFSSNDTTLFVYRGQGMFSDEFDNLRRNVGGNISINSFFSASTSSEIALIFAGEGTGRPLIESVLFEIEIDTSIISKPFGNIQNVSYLKTENEILFAMGTIFRIETVEPLSEKIWLIKLVLSREDERLSELMAYFKNDIGRNPNLLTFAIYLYKMGDYVRAEKYLRIILRQQAMNPIDKAIIFNCIAGLYDEKGNYDKALILYKKALNIQLKHQVLWKDPQRLAMTYNNIGKAFDSNGQYNLALKYYKNALEIDRVLLKGNKSDLSVAYGNIASVRLEQGKFGQALQNSTKALNLRFHCMPRDHPDIAITYNNIGQIHFKIGNYSEASMYYKKALDIQEKFLMPTHSSLAVTYSNVGELNSELGYYNLALENYKKAVDIQQNTLPLNHPDLAVIFDNIGCVYSKKEEFDTALEYFHKALSIELISLARDHPALGTTYNNIGNAYYHKKQYVLALQNLRKAIKVRLASSRGKRLSLTSSYNNMALVYYQLRKYAQALKYHKRSRAIKLSHLPAYHPDLGSSYNNIGLIYHKKGNYNMALKNYEKCIDIRLRTLPENHPDIGITYDNIGMVYCDKQDYDNALIYLNKALDIQLPTNQPNVAITYLNLAHVYLKQRNRDMTLAYYTKYAEIQNKLTQAKP